jgi:hypothetical protein
MMVLRMAWTDEGAGNMYGSILSAVRLHIRQGSQSRCTTSEEPRLPNHPPEILEDHAIWSESLLPDSYHRKYYPASGSPSSCPEFSAFLELRFQTSPNSTRIKGLINALTTMYDVLFAFAKMK